MLLGAVRVESLGGMLFLGCEVLAASSRGRLTGGATIVLLVLEELDWLAIAEVFASSVLPLDPGVLVLLFCEAADCDD